MILIAHNPEVAGSNPASATKGELLTRKAFGHLTVKSSSFLCNQKPPETTMKPQSTIFLLESALYGFHSIYLIPSELFLDNPR